jgi:uncharacterized protein DUF6328
MGIATVEPNESVMTKTLRSPARASSAVNHRPRDSPGAALRAESEEHPPAERAPGRSETKLERLDRNLVEMMGETRVIITGIQVLFGFLLVVPFDPGFAQLGTFGRVVYFVTLLLAALAAVCTIAPAAQHRVLFRLDDKRHIVFTANRTVIAGLAFLAMAMCGSLMLVASKLFGELAGGIVVTFAALPFTVLWFALPLARRRRLGRSQRSYEEHDRG